MRFLLFLPVLVAVTFCQPGDEEVKAVTAGETANKKVAAVKKIDWNGHVHRAGQERIYGWGVDRVGAVLRVSDGDRKKPARDRATFVAWRKKHGARRSYRNTTDVELHARIFEQTEQMIAENRAAFARGEVTYQLALNEFADYSEEDYARMTMSDAVVANHVEFLTGMNATEESVDRTNRVKRAANLDFTYLLPPVKHQGACGACYAFGAIATVEALCKRTTGRECRFSEQVVADCTMGKGSNEMKNNGCDGGWPMFVYDYLTQNGARNWSLYPYRENVQASQCPSPDKKKELFKIKGYRRVQPGNEVQLFESLRTAGPISIGVDTRPRRFLYYSSGVLDLTEECLIGRPNHIMTLVGNDLEGINDYYLIRNSWGTGWGYGGYVKFKRGVNMCGMTEWAMYPVPLD